MFNSERKVSARRIQQADITTTSSDKMSLCRACLVLLKTQDSAYDLYREKDLAAKFISCMGSTNDSECLRTTLEEEVRPQFVLKCICECCYQLVQKFYDFQRMCEESSRNFEKLMSKVMEQRYNPAAELETQLENLKAGGTVQAVSTEVSTMPESIEDIEEVYIIEDERTSRILGKERIPRQSIPKRPRGTRHTIDCTICSRRFYKMSLYEAHMQRHRGEQPHKCTVDKCEKIYARANLLTIHLREAHQNHVKTYPCTRANCNKVYSALRSLNYHIRQQHAQEPVPYSNPTHMCEKCGKSFGRKAHLTRHQWVHKGKRECNFVCKLCGQRFYTNHNLKDHFLRRHSKKRLLRCKRCGRIFGSLVALSVHMKQHTKLKLGSIIKN